MYTSVLTIHSWLRWVTLLLAVAATVNAVRPHTGRVSPLPGRWWDTLLMLVVDLQVLFGVLLYFGLSPFTRVALQDLGATLRTPAMRFWGIEHAAGMIGAVVLVRMGRVLAMNALSPASARRRRLICFGAATVLMIAVIPWPGLSNGRPLFRGL